ncbi:MAG: ATP-binding cassette domain-containing protein [Clostridia bacterium]
MEYIIEVKKLTKSFSKKTVVDCISFFVEKGSLFAFLGQNGAGKTTTINMIIGLLSQEEGEILYQGSSDFKRFKNKIGVVFQNNILDDFLSVEENLLTYSALYHNTKSLAQEHYARVINLLSLDEVCKQQFRTLSGGQKRKAEIARALLTAPEILFLDEPTTGLDPKTRADVWAVIDNLKNVDGMTIFLTTHYMEETALADKVAIINKGKIVVTGSPLELKTEYSSDKLIITPYDAKTLESYLTKNELSYQRNSSTYTLEISNVSHSIDLLHSMKENIRFYEVTKGSMDDVFLNVVGEKLYTNGGIS